MLDVTRRVLFVHQIDHSENLLTHEQGTQLGRRIRQQLAELPSPGLLILDFTEIKHVTFNCLAEGLKVLRERSASPGKHLALKVRHLHSDLRDLFDLYAKTESVVLLCCDARGKWEIVGHLTHSLRTALQVAQEHDVTTANQLTEQLNIPLGAASNRLRRLHQLGLLFRSEESLPVTGGRRFVYSFVGPNTDRNHGEPATSA